MTTLLFSQKSLKEALRLKGSSPVLHFVESFELSEISRSFQSIIHQLHKKNKAGLLKYKFRNTWRGLNQELSGFKNNCN